MSHRRHQITMPLSILAPVASSRFLLLRLRRDLLLLHPPRTRLRGRHKDSAAYASARIRPHTRQSHQSDFTCIPLFKKRAAHSCASLGRGGRERIGWMGELGIGCLCYNWMPSADWSRTSTTDAERGGANGCGLFKPFLESTFSRLFFFKRDMLLKRDNSQCEFADRSVPRGAWVQARW